MYNTGEYKGFSPSMLMADDHINYLGVFGFSFVCVLGVLSVYFACGHAIDYWRGLK